MQVALEREFAEKSFHRPMQFSAQLEREMIQQFGMRRLRAGRAEVFQRLDEAVAEHLGPQAIREHARRERILIADNPARHVEAGERGIALRRLGHVGDAGLHRLVACEAIATDEDARLPGRSLRAFDHDRHRCAGKFFQPVA